MNTLKNRRVLLTRGPEASGALTTLLQVHGAEVEHLETIDILPVALDPGALREVMEASRQADWIAFVSALGVAFYQRLLAAHACEVPASARLAAVGQSTATAVQAAFFKAPLVGAVSTAAGLGAAIVEAARKDARQVVVPRAKNGRLELVQCLRSAGFHVTDAPLYEARPRADRGRKKAPISPAVSDIVVMSPSAITGLLAQRTLSPEVRLISIGPTTTQAAIAFGLNVSQQAFEPSVDGLLAALMREARNKEG